MTKPTAGPWKHGHDGHGAFSIDAPCGRQICYVRNEANAALIARAPELAARVEELTEDIADHKQIIEDKRERNKELRAHNARLRGLLRECVEFLPMALQATIYEELGQ